MAIPPDSPQALLIAGMHRSGTSAAALALAQLGWSLGADQLETQVSINRDGFGENEGVVALNEKLLAHFGAAWYQLFDWPEGWEHSAEAEPFLAEARKLITEQFSSAQHILLKDPRLCLTLPLWLEALGQEGFNSRVILQWRHPQAVASSLQRRDSLPLPAGLVLWLHYTLAAERHSRGVERAWLRYETLLEQGASALALFQDIVIPEGMDAGIDAGLAHHGVSGFSHSDTLTSSCQSVMDAITEGGEPTSALWQDMQSRDMTSLFNDLTSALTRRAADTVAIGGEHSRALDVIAEKDRALESSAEYARQCEAVIAEKDAALVERNAAVDEVTAYARECERVVAEKDADIEKVNRYVAECEAAVSEKDREIADANGRADGAEAELLVVRSQMLYRLLRKLRVLK